MSGCDRIELVGLEDSPFFPPRDAFWIDGPF